MAKKESGGVPQDLPIKFIGSGDVPVLYSNSFVIQSFPDKEFVLNFCHGTLPIYLGSPEEIRKQAESLGFAPIKVICRVALSRKRLGELAELCRSQMEKTAEVGE